MVVTVAEQVTTATQQRDFQDFGNSDELQLELSPQQRSIKHTGDVIVQFLSLFYSTLDRILSSWKARNPTYRTQ